MNSKHGTQGNPISRALKPARHVTPRHVTSCPRLVNSPLEINYCHWRQWITTDFQAGRDRWQTVAQIIAGHRRILNWIPPLPHSRFPWSSCDGFPLKSIEINQYIINHWNQTNPRVISRFPWHMRSGRDKKPLLAPLPELLRALACGEGQRNSRRWCTTVFFFSFFYCTEAQAEEEATRFIQLFSCSCCCLSLSVFHQLSTSAVTTRRVRERERDEQKYDLIFTYKCV